MIQQFAATLCAVLALAGAPQVTQVRPDFTGRWVPADPPAATEILTITQNERELKAVRTDGTGTESARYTFAGPAIQDVTHPNVTVTSIAAWNGPVLEVITTFKTTDSGNVISVRSETWSLDGDGRLLIQISSVRGNSPARTSRAVYVRR